MNKNEFLELNKKVDKNYNWLILCPCIMIFSLVSCHFLVILISNVFNINNENALILSTIIVSLVFLFAMFFCLKGYKRAINERDNWLIRNENALIKDEGIIHKHAIIDITDLQNNLSNKMNIKKTRLFKKETDLIEVIYMKDGRKYKLITEAAVLNEKPQHISYIEFDKEGTFYKNGFYNLTCE